ncbi:hypothetical protein [Azospirillum sp.]|uniref:hypothetical protein n=1 Tax=Azospirillum sp. TaxID=34012 RepID=UPI003D7612E4
MSTEAIPAILLVLLGIGALGGMVVMEVSRLGLLSARRALVQKRIEALRSETERARERAGQIDAAIERGQAQLAHFAAEVQRLASLLRTVEADRVELVHDLGAPDGRPAPFRCVLRTVPDFARLDQRHVVFSRDIWQRKNVAHVWADTPEQAHAQLLRAFPARSGVLAGAIERVTERAAPIQPMTAPKTPDGFIADPSLVAA